MSWTGLRELEVHLPPLQSTLGTIALGGVLNSTLTRTPQPDFVTVPPVGIIAAVLAMSLLGSVLAYRWWNDGVRRVGAGPFICIAFKF